MTQARQEAVRTGRIEPTMTVAHRLMRDWIGLFMKHGSDFVLSPRMTGLMLTDQ